MIKNRNINRIFDQIESRRIMTAETDNQIGEEERKRIRAEMRYALAVLQETKPASKKTSVLQSTLSYLSNGFVLLIVGSLITSILLPKFQQAYENKKQKTNLMQECLSQYLLYANSIWKEYYSIFPLVHHPAIDMETYNKYLAEIGTIKLSRYDAYAKVKALAIVFRGDNQETPSKVERELEDFARQVNQISETIDLWLRNLYCSPNKCISDGIAPIDPNFSPYGSFLRLQTLLRDIQGIEHIVAESMVRQIKTIE